MAVLSGATLPYLKYRQLYSQLHSQIRELPVVWRWRELAEQFDASAHTERGTLTLSTAGTAGRCELVPGMAITIQVVRAGDRTRPHAHAWWHLFFVQAGTGTMVLGKAQDVVQLSRNDLVLVPAWCEHHFENMTEPENLVLMSITNLPQQAGLSNLLANEPEDCPEGLEIVPDETI
jgi:gentisate 1,2-dioxygenase